MSTTIGVTRHEFCNAASLGRTEHRCTGVEFNPAATTNGSVRVPLQRR